MKIRVVERFNPGNGHKTWRIEDYAWWQGWSVMDNGYCASEDEVYRKLAQLRRYGHLLAIERVAKEFI